MEVSEAVGGSHGQDHGEGDEDEGLPRDQLAVSEKEPFHATDEAIINESEWIKCIELGKERDRV